MSKTITQQTENSLVNISKPSNVTKLDDENQTQINKVPTSKTSRIEPALIIKKGYITKLKSKKKRFFVLYNENDTNDAHLDYFESEKKFETNSTAYKRLILLKDCFAVIKKHDPRFKTINIFVFAIYTRDDCFSLMFDDAEVMNSWFSIINELHIKSLAKNKTYSIHGYDKIWYVVIREKKSKLRGSFYFCLTTEGVHLYKINNGANAKDKRLSSSSDKSTNQTENAIARTSSISDKSEKSTANISSVSSSTISENDVGPLPIHRFPFSLIREFGHQSNNNLFINLGRSSDIGSCKLWFKLKDCDTPQHIHSLWLNTQRQLNNSSESRGRSNSENSRMPSRKNKSIALQTQKSNNSTNAPITHSKTTSFINQMLSKSISGNSKSSSSLKYNSNDKSLARESDDQKTNKNSKKTSNELIASSIANSMNSSTNQLAQRCRSTSENSHLLSDESMKSTSGVAEEEESDYYMTTPDVVQPVSACLNKDEDYMVVDKSMFMPQSLKCSSPCAKRTYSNASTVQINRDDLKLVSTTGPLAKKFTKHQLPIENSQQQHYYSPVNNDFIDLSNSLFEENEADEYLQVEFSAKKVPIAQQQSHDKYHQHTIHNRSLEVISSEPSSSSSCSEMPQRGIMLANVSTCANSQSEHHQAEEEDYIGIESFSSTATNHQKTENFEASCNLSPVSSASCNRAKTLSMSSNDTSNNELNSLGTSPSLMSNLFCNTTPVNYGKAREEVYKLEKVKSYFNSTEDCDYIKPVRTYSIGSRPQMTSHHKYKHPYSLISKSSTINGPTFPNNNQAFVMNHSVKKVQCGHMLANLESNICNHSDENAFSNDNRVRAYSTGSHSTANKDFLLRKLRLNQLSRQKNTTKTETIEDEESTDKCLSTPLLDKQFTRNRSATFTTSFAASSTTSTASKKTYEDSSEEDDMMCIDLSKSAPFGDPEDFTVNHLDTLNSHQILIKEKFKELSLDTDEVKTKDV